MSYLGRKEMAVGYLSHCICVCLCCLCVWLCIWTISVRHCPHKHPPPPVQIACHRQGKGKRKWCLRSISPTPHPSLLHFKIAVTNCPRSQHYFWPYSAAAAASAAYLRTDSYLEVCKIRGNLLSENILPSIALKGSGRSQVIFRD